MHSHCTSATLPWKASMGKDQGIPIPSSDPLLEETQLITSTAGHTPAPKGHAAISCDADRGVSKKHQQLEPPPFTSGGNRALPGFGLHKTATQKQSKDSDYLNQLGWGQTAALNCKSTCEMWALHCLQAEEKAKEALKGCSAHNSWDKGKEGKEGKEGKPQYPCPALGHTAQLTTCLFQQFLPWLPHCYQQDSLQVKGGEFKFTQIRIRIW